MGHFKSSIESVFLFFLKRHKTSIEDESIFGVRNTICFFFSGKDSNVLRGLDVAESVPSFRSYNPKPATKTTGLITMTGKSVSASFKIRYITILFVTRTRIYTLIDE